MAHCTEPIEYSAPDLQEDTRWARSWKEMSRRPRRAEESHQQWRRGWCGSSSTVPTRGLIGLRGLILNSTRGNRHHVASVRVLRYLARSDGGAQSRRPRRAGAGKSTNYALQQPAGPRGDVHYGQESEVYEGMIIGENARGDDMVVNVARAKKQTNMRAAGKRRQRYACPAA